MSMGSAIPQANLPPITATGARGYLQWLKADQPGLYQRVLPQLRAQVPQLWSDALQTRVMSNLGRVLGGLGQDDDDDDDDDSGDDSGDGIQPVAVATVSPDLTDLSSLADDTGLGADNADTTATDPGDASTVSNIVGSTLGTAENESLAAITQDLSDSQLQSATAGSYPSATGTSGIGQVFSTLQSSLGSSGTVLLIGGGLLLMALLMAGE
jgi:hypothetical protein